MDEFNLKKQALFESSKSLFKLNYMKTEYTIIIIKTWLITNTLPRQTKIWPTKIIQIGLRTLKSLTFAKKTSLIITKQQKKRYLPKSRIRLNEKNLKNSFIPPPKVGWAHNIPYLRSIVLMKHMNWIAQT